jgi:hypothetical protein
MVTADAPLMVRDLLNLPLKSVIDDPPGSIFVWITDVLELTLRDKSRPLGGPRVRQIGEIRP